MKYDNDSWPLVKPPSPRSLLLVTPSLSLAPALQLSHWSSQPDCPLIGRELTWRRVHPRPWATSGGGKVAGVSLFHIIFPQEQLSEAVPPLQEQIPTCRNVLSSLKPAEAGGKVIGSLPRPVWPLPISCSRADRAAQASATNTTLLAQPEPDLRTAEERGERERVGG